MLKGQTVNIQQRQPAGLQADRLCMHGCTPLAARAFPRRSEGTDLRPTFHFHATNRKPRRAGVWLGRHASASSYRISTGPLVITTWVAPARPHPSPSPCTDQRGTSAAACNLQRSNPSPRPIARGWADACALPSSCGERVDYPSSRAAYRSFAFYFCLPRRWPEEVGRLLPSTPRATRVARTLNYCSKYRPGIRNDATEDPPSGRLPG